LPLSDGIHLAWSLLSYEANELERASEQVHRALDPAERAGVVDGVLWGWHVLARVHLAQGDLSALREITRKGHDLATRLDVHQSKAQWFSALEAQASLLEGDLAAAVRWADGSGIRVDERPHLWDELSRFTYVRILLAQDRLDDAQALLRLMEQSAEEGQRHRKLITIHLQQALVQQASGHMAEAMSRAEKAVKLAAPEGYRRAFLNEGPAIVDLLPRARHIAPDFVMQVLAAPSGPGPVAPPPGAHALVETLSERELQIVRLMAAGRSNPEIAQRLYLSLNTVKWHAKNLFGKLNVNNRVEAAARARELQLL
jgi:LuxR family maltose regulon positive regulatory protein